MAIKNRNEMDPQYTWDVDSVYATPEAWEADFARLAQATAPIQALRGKLKDGPSVAALFKAQDELGVLLNKLYLYAHMVEDSDLSNSESQARMGRMRSQYAKISGELAWIEPTLLEESEETLRAWAATDAMAPYRRSIELLLRQKPHTLSVNEETLLGLAGDIFSVPNEAFSKLTNADFRFESAKDKDGKEHDVSNGTFLSLLQRPDRTLRKNAFASVYTEYQQHGNTLATLLHGSTKSHVFNASIRKFPNALEASLFNDNIPCSVYTSLIEAVHRALPTFHRYVELRAEALRLKGELNVWDLHTPIIADLNMPIDWATCRRWVGESTKPLGAEYHAVVERSFQERWFDVYENKGKRSGAYSTGAYGEKPFMLLNYHDSLDDVFTVAHEQGHSMHTWLSQQTQPYRYSGYPIFLAEIASTTNEALLHHHLMTTEADDKLRAYLLNHLCDSFRGTLFRQTMFAEFELWIHEQVEAGKPLTVDSVKAYYYDLNARYYGPSFKADDRIAFEWMRIPHFYYNFYVYKYATGFAAAQIFVKQILSGDEGRDRYLRFLKAGSIKDPLDIVREAGVDMADPAVMEKAFATFDGAISELAAIVL